MQSAASPLSASPGDAAAGLPSEAPAPAVEAHWGYTRVILGDIVGLYWGNIGVIVGLYWGYIGVILGLF